MPLSTRTKTTPSSSIPAARKRSAARDQAPDQMPTADATEVQVQAAVPDTLTEETPTADREQRIREAAYHRYLQRGAGDGQAVDDWLAAESALSGEQPPSPEAVRH